MSTSKIRFYRNFILALCVLMLITLVEFIYTNTIHESFVPSSSLSIATGMLLNILNNYVHLKFHLIKPLIVLKVPFVIILTIFVSLLMCYGFAQLINSGWESASVNFFDLSIFFILNTLSTILGIKLKLNLEAPQTKRKNRKRKK